MNLTCDLICKGVFLHMVNNKFCLLINLSVTKVQVTYTYRVTQVNMYQQTFLSHVSSDFSTVTQSFSVTTSPKLKKKILSTGFCAWPNY